MLSTVILICQNGLTVSTKEADYCWKVASNACRQTNGGSTVKGLILWIVLLVSDVGTIATVEEGVFCNIKSGLGRVCNNIHEALCYVQELRH